MIESRDSGIHPKLLDFGLSRAITRNAKRLGGTMRWAAPEVFSQPPAPPRTSADVFSFGYLIFFVITGRRPLDRVSDEAIAQLGSEGVVLPLEWPALTPLVQRSQPIIMEATLPSPQSRPSLLSIYRNIECWPDPLETEACRVDDSDAPRKTGAQDFWQAVRQMRKAKRPGLSGLAVPGQPQLKYPELLETQHRSMARSLQQLILRWNPRISTPHGCFCCTHHASECVLYQMMLQMRQTSCKEASAWPHGDFKQCPECGIISFDRDSVSTSRCFQCDVCGYMPDAETVAAKKHVQSL